MSRFQIQLTSRKLSSRRFSQASFSSSLQLIISSNYNSCIVLLALANSLVGRVFSLGISFALLFSAEQHLVSKCLKSCGTCCPDIAMPTLFTIIMRVGRLVLIESSSTDRKRRSLLRKKDCRGRVLVGMTNNTVWLQLLGLSIILIMYMHQALPKELPAGKRPAYQITKKFSPKQRQPFSHLVEHSDQSSIKHSSSEKTHLHHISSKQKPHMASVEKLVRPAMVPKPIHSLLVQKSGETLPKAQTPQTVDYHQSSGSKRADSPLRDTVICRMDNKVSKTMTVPFLYTDLSKIEESYCQTYEGENKMNGIRHGFGTQYYTNGEKFTGFFEQNKAHGQGTYYSLRRKVMGIWQHDKLREIIHEC